MSRIILPIPALHDNYIWTIVHPETRSAVIVDPGEAAPILELLDTRHLSLTAILITHHHWDHTGGIEEILQKHAAPVYAPAHDSVTFFDKSVQEGDVITLSTPNLNFNVLAIPGHTRGHIAYYGHGWVFTGDTLFSGGCGRIFEGTPEQLYCSLMKLSQLDPETQVYCGHEYTHQNLTFAKQVEPDNKHLQQRIQDTVQKRQKGQPTLPSTIALELATNPFIRCTNPTIQKNVASHVGHALHEPVSVFAALRQWKDDSNR